MNLIYILYITNILIHLLSVIITAIFIVPLQIREARVKNGLAVLRKQLLAFGVLVIVVGIASVIALTLPLFERNGITLYLSLTTVTIHAFAFLGFAILGYQIYHTQYTDEIKEAHKELDKIRSGQASAKK